VKHLRQLEDQSVYILREAYKHFDNLAMLWSMGKDSTVLLWLARKAFFGHVPFPLLHVDTSFKIPAMIEYRDRLAREWHLNLVVGQNKDALAAGMNHTLGRVTCCTALKTNGLKQLLEQKGYTGVILGVRADEEGTRAKERYFSPRDKHGDWDFRDQPPDHVSSRDTHQDPSVAGLDGNQYLGVHQAREYSFHRPLPEQGRWDSLSQSGLCSLHHADQIHGENGR
jgi:sulfate adenylyltransferase subunit 2